jgi:hypothetical protein
MLMPFVDCGLLISLFQLRNIRMDNAVQPLNRGEPLGLRGPLEIGAYRRYIINLFRNNKVQ